MASDSDSCGVYVESQHRPEDLIAAALKFNNVDVSNLLLAFDQVSNIHCCHWYQFFVVAFPSLH
jgi:hypothetical protein